MDESQNFTFDHNEVDSNDTHDYLEALKVYNLPIYNSTDSLSLRIYDYSNVYLLPAICVFGIITSGLSIFVLVKTGITQNIHLYMLIAAVSDFSFLMTQVFIALFRCGTLCPYGYTRPSKIYELYIYLYVGYVIVTFSALVDISISIDRIMLFSSNSKIVTRQRFAVRCVILLAVSALLILPDLALAREVVPMGILVHWETTNGTIIGYTYELLYTNAMKKDWLYPGIQIPLSVLSIAKGPALIGMVLLVDLIVIFKFQKHLKRKQAISSTLSSKENKENRESNRTTYMIISISLLYSIGNSLDSLAAVIELFGVNLYYHLPMYVITGNCLLFGSHGLYLFIYYNFDKEYNKLFQQVLLRREKLVNIRGTTFSHSHSTGHIKSTTI